MTIIALHDYIRKIDQLLEESRYSEAEDHCRHILAQYPRHLGTYRLLAKALLEQHRYEDAADLFQRVLSADPNDLVAHVGLADIYRQESLLDQSLWHLERAFELEPYNHVIQDELRKLYVKHSNLTRDVAPSAARDVAGDVVLERIPLNQAALGRIYLRGELYREAVNEVRQVLAMQPEVADRVDLEVVLAEALWRDEQRIDAAEVCQHILEQLPSCVIANAILGDIWLQAGRAGEAQQYLRRVQALTQVDSSRLDPERAVGHAFSLEGAPPLPQTVTIELLGIAPEEVASAASLPTPTADWVKEVVQPSVAQPEVADEATEQLMAEAPDAEGVQPEVAYDWLDDVVDMQSEVADALPVDAADEVWQPEVEEKVQSDWFADPTIQGETEAADVQPEDVALPDWLAELNEAAEPQSADLDFDDVTDLFGERESMEPADMQPEVAQPEVTQPEVADLDDFEPDTSEIPTWLRGQVTTDTPVHSDIPDWLSQDVTESETAPGEEAGVPPEMPDWLADVTSVDDLEPVEADPMLASDWFGDLEEGEGDLQAEDASSTDMQPEVDEDWLAALARDTGGLPEQSAAGDEAAPTEFFDLMPEGAAGADLEPQVADEVADWLLGDLAEQTEWEEGVIGDNDKKDSGQQDGPEPEEEAAGKQPEVADDSMEWLEAPNSQQDAQEPSVMEELAGEELPDWLSDLSGTTEADEGADEPEQATLDYLSPEVADDIPDWLRTSAMQPEDADEALLATGEVAEAEEAESTEADVQPEVADELSYLDSIAAGEEPPVDEPLTQATRAAMEDDTELSDWLSELEREGSPDEGAEALDWLDQLASGQREPVEQMPTLEWSDESEEDETSLDWLSELAAAPDETLVSLGLTEDADQSGDTLEEDTVVDVPEDLDDAMAWLEELAARQGAPVEELPTVAKVLESDVGDEADEADEEEHMTAEGMPETAPEEAAEEETADLLADVMQPEVADDMQPEVAGDAMAWLEELAAKQGTPLEELPGLREASQEEAGAELELEAMAFEVQEEEVVVEEPDVLLPEPDESFEDAMVDLDEAMAWLEDLMAEQDTSLEEEDLEAPEPVEMTVAEEDEVAMIWPPSRRESEAESRTIDDDIQPEVVEEALEWLEQMALEDGPLPELENIRVDATEEELEEALDWLEQVATGQVQPPAVAVEVAWTEVELEVGDVLYEEEEEVVAITAESDVTPAEPEDDLLATLSPMPEDPEEALAWLEQLAAEAGAEAAAEVPAEEAEAEATAEALASVELPEALIRKSGGEGEEAVEEDQEAVEPELDFLADMPDDPDEAMAWLEKLAARQGAPLEELPSIAVDEAEEIVTPEWIAAESAMDVEAVREPPLLDEAEMEAAEPEEGLADVEGQPETIGEVEPEAELEPVEMEVEAPEVDEAAEEEAPEFEEAGRPEGLPDVDIGGWLEAEAEATTMDVEETAPLVETGSLLSAVPERPLEPDYELKPEIEDEDLILAETEPVVSALALDEAQLAHARQALAAGHTDDAMASYHSLVTKGKGLITLIGDLEAAVDQHPQQPLLRRLLGDAYIRNGQIQKALETYRETLDQL